MKPVLPAVPVALLVADIHLCHTPPVARSVEPDWYAAMAHPLNQLCQLQQQYGCPVVCAGDVFDRWNPPPELINWAIDHLPRMYAVRGQHDLPMHLESELHKSAFQTLVKAGVIRDLNGTGSCLTEENFLVGDEVRRLCLYGYGWGRDVLPLDGREDYPDDRDLYVAVVHNYIWAKGHQYPGAPRQSHLHSWSDRLSGYTVGVFGDNHSPFQSHAGDCVVWNCGCLIRRKSDERAYRPRVGLLYEDGSIGEHLLDVGDDVWLDSDTAPDLQEVDEEVDRLMRELGELGSDSLDFREAVNRYLSDNKVSPEVQEQLLWSLERER